MKKYKEFAIPAVSLILMVLLILSTQYKVRQVNQENQYTIDSMRQEIIEKDIEIQRYEYVIYNLDSTTKGIVDSMLSETE